MGLEITPSFPMLIFSLFFAFLLWVLIRKNFKSSSSEPLNLPPGPRKLPFIGNLHQLIGDLPHRILANWAKKYGPVMKIQLGEVPVVIISSRETAKEIMTTQDVVLAHRPPMIVSDIVFYKATDMAFAPYGEHWKQLRKICMTELLCPTRVRLLRSVREEAVSNFIRSIASASSEGTPVNLSKMLHSLTCTVISRATFGDECEEQEEIIPIAEEVVKMVTGLCIPDLFPSIKMLPVITGIRSKLKKLQKKIDFVLEKIINKHKKVTSQIEMEKKDIVDVLLHLQEHGNLELPLTTDTIKGLILDMFFGGIDTSATLVEWVMSEMIKNPKMMQKVQEEVRQVFGDTENIDEAKIDKLEYLKLIIKETLRLHPPVPLQPARQASDHCQINGYDIPAETRVLINFWALGRDPNYWSEPEKFSPERFIDNQINYKGVNFEYLPFGSGRRLCPGMVFGMATVEHTLARLLYQFDWKLSDGKKKEDLDMKAKFGAVAKRVNDLYLVPIPYHHNM
ncbi:desmethyl-deoxy-podophyllotoxin synthase-like [Mercurialis annua]|uniref:desmethyl-deoxy-podophyllotoxin synthase-like n=1 Tax=Mercurialis annua TaxID=3986 RepID=UPI00215FC4AF|nr:desmethyl-deoxy-podophyllotoxin synthase-like [Mercurialis annua]